MKKLLLLVFVIFLSCNSKKSDYFEAIAENDIKLFPPKPGDWLYSYKEKGQSFEQFLNSKHIIPSKGNNVIYLQPIGKFDSLQAKQIQLVKEYLEIFFQLKTKTLDNVSNDVIPKHARRIGPDQNEQFLAGFILDSVLKKEKPQNGIGLMALTEVDLYPKPEWSFVFGLASYRDKIAVSSMYRMQKEADFSLALERLLKICSHEIGHMFGLHHCIEASCVMNGTNSMIETDSHSIRLCSLCQRKLNSGFKYDNLKRLKELEEFFQENNLNEGLSLMKKDFEKI
jgi:archaemetzincin